MASSSKICGSGGNVTACGRRLGLAGTFIYLIDFAGCGNCNFAFYMPKAYSFPASIAPPLMNVEGIFNQAAAINRK